MVIQVTEANLGTAKYHYISSAKPFTLHLNVVYPSLRLKVVKNTRNAVTRRGNLAEEPQRAQKLVLNPPVPARGLSRVLSRAVTISQLQLALSCGSCRTEVLMKGNYDDDLVLIVY